MKIKTMKAAVLAESKKPLVIAQLELPEVLECGQVLVQIHYSGICGAQINEIEAVKGPDKFLPHLLGHEASATVLEIGPGVKTVKEGDTVVMHWRPSDGIQATPASYKWDGRKVNSGWVTTFSEYSIVSENRLTVIKDEFDLRLLPLFGCAVTTAMGVINNDAQVKVGQSVVIYGVGGVGLNVCQSADMVSANPIVAVDLFDNKLEMAKKFGATHVINSNKTDNTENEIRRIVGEAGPDIVIETTGNARVVERAYEVTHKDGKTILVGVPSEKVNIYTLPIHFKKILKGSEGGSCIPHIDIPRYIKLIKSGRMTLDGIITDEFDLNHINDAIDLLKSGKAGRVIIKM
jgi:S-(hydroxymethyl)glutathione dehydrogenase/alcohol dehydrogenase